MELSVHSQKHEVMCNYIISSLGLAEPPLRGDLGMTTPPLHEKRGSLHIDPFF